VDKFVGKMPRNRVKAADSLALQQIAQISGISQPFVFA
jgi:hypothetical protein